MNADQVEPSYENVKTNDVALVAVLRMSGLTHDEVTYDEISRTVWWTFSGDRAVACAEEFRADRTMVNPRLFTKAYGEAKREMYDLIDAN